VSGNNEPAWATVMMAAVEKARKECSDGHLESMIELGKIGTRYEFIANELTQIKTIQRNSAKVQQKQGERISSSESSIDDMKEAAKLVGLGNVSFWNGPNGGTALKIGGSMIVGLMVLAGLNMATLKDFL
tara:strand:- start:237 stop:626 length:390 start_codon:yes stop_codon:yes gene_type:complete